MKFGIFDHMDEADVPLGQQFEERLKLIGEEIIRAFGTIAA
ncbi:MAG TPA: hypothetical protein VKQ06_03305 [Gammaproteobacteria bacterium]|nr:hypothetical protein [Gammaproteobacteria bacterium]